LFIKIKLKIKKYGNLYNKNSIKFYGFIIGFLSTVLVFEIHKIESKIIIIIDFHLSLAGIYIKVPHKHYL